MSCDFCCKMSRKGGGEAADDDEIKDIPVWKCIAFIIIGGVLVVKGSN